MIITGEARLLEREIFQGRPQELPELPRRELVDAEPYAANYEILKNEPNGVETVQPRFSAQHLSDERIGLGSSGGRRAGPHRQRAAGARVTEAMPTPTEFFHWWIVDERTGKRRLTTYKLTRADAARAFPGAEPDMQTREIRDLPDPGDAYPNSRPGGDWS